MTERLFVDTSTWFAFVNRRDPEHAPTKTLLEEHGGRLVTSNYILDETVTLCLDMTRAAALDDDFRREGFDARP